MFSPHECCKLAKNYVPWKSEGSYMLFVELNPPKNGPRRDIHSVGIQYKTCLPNKLYGNYTRAQVKSVVFGLRTLSSSRVHSS